VYRCTIADQELYKGIAALQGNRGTGILEEYRIRSGMQE
jgi:hypothetical protein